MRYLMLTRGMPFCGKTSWINQYNLQDYTLDSKLFKKLAQSPILDEFGNTTLANFNDRIAFQMLFSALESRMSKGDFIIVEDNHISKSYFSNYKEMARAYAYTIFIVDFSNIALEDIIKRNETIRNEKSLKHFYYTQVQLQTLYNELQHSSIPIKCEIIKPEEIISFLKIEPKNLNHYKVIHHIGDIQGSFSVLQKYLGKMRDDEFYIFLGDYIDRGFQNYEVLRFLLTIMDKKNVCLLEGNHERWLWRWANNKEIESKEFTLNTQPELEQKGFSKVDAKRLYYKLVPYFFYKFHEKRVICTHGGISNMPEYPPLLSATQSIHGIGDHFSANAIAESFSKNTPKNYYQFFGHRNKTDLPICIHERNFVMESQVEFGGFLRAVQLTQQGFKNASIRNTIFISKEEKEARKTLQKCIDLIQKYKQITTTEVNDFISVYYPTKAPQAILDLESCFSPCVIDNKNWQIVARGHHLSQYTHTTIKKVEQLHFPLQVFAKQQGIQACISYYNGKFWYFYDSFVQESFSREDLPYFLQPQETQKELIKLFKNKSHSIIVMLTDMNDFILLDCIENTILGNRFDSYNLDKLAHILKIPKQESIYNLDSHDLDDFLRLFAKHNIMTSHKLQANTLFLESFTFHKQDYNTPNLCGLILMDKNKRYYNLDSYYDSELKILEHCIKVWKMQTNISKLEWINNPFRLAFYEWFQAFINEEEWQQLPIAWIQNRFLAHLSLLK